MGVSGFLVGLVVVVCIVLGCDGESLGGGLNGEMNGCLYGDKLWGWRVIFVWREVMNDEMVWFKWF